eukprot:3417276-Amphidinium_carterae.1
MKLAFPNPDSSCDRTWPKISGKKLRKYFGCWHGVAPGQSIRQSIAERSRLETEESLGKALCQ